MELPKEYKKLSKKQLRECILQQINQNTLIVSENYTLNRELEQKEKHLRSAENALIYKDEVIEKYKTLLTTSVEDL